MSIDELLRFMVQQEASDLHLKPMRPPLVRMKGKLLPLKTDALHPDLLRDMLNGLLNDRMRKQLEENCAIDFGHSVSGVSGSPGRLAWRWTGTPRSAHTAHSRSYCG